MLFFNALNGSSLTSVLQCWGGFHSVHRCPLVLELGCLALPSVLQRRGSLYSVHRCFLVPESVQLSPFASRCLLLGTVKHSAQQLVFMSVNLGSLLGEALRKGFVDAVPGNPTSAPASRFPKPPPWQAIIRKYSHRRRNSMTSACLQESKWNLELPCANDLRDNRD